jgi:hypothetical protein
MAEFEDSRAPDISVPMDRNKNKIDTTGRNIDNFLRDLIGGEGEDGRASPVMGVLPRATGINNPTMYAMTAPPLEPLIPVDPSGNEFNAGEMSPKRVIADAGNTRDFDKTLSLQKALNNMGAGLSEDGIMGPKTRAAQEKFSLTNRDEDFSSIMNQGLSIEDDMNPFNTPAVPPVVSESVPPAVPSVVPNSSPTPETKRTGNRNTRRIPPVGKMPSSTTNTNNTPGKQTGVRGQKGNPSGTLNDGIDPELEMTGQDPDMVVSNMPRPENIGRANQGRRRNEQESLLQALLNLIDNPSGNVSLDEDNINNRSAN